MSDMQLALPILSQTMSINDHSPTFQGNMGVGVTAPAPNSFGYGQPPAYGYYSQLGQQAQGFMNQIQQQGQVAPYNPYQQQEQQDMTQVYNEAYKAGKMSLSEYCTYNNGGISTNQQPNYNTYPGYDDWYRMPSWFANQQEQQRKMQEEYENQQTQWRILRNVSNRQSGIKEMSAQDYQDQLQYEQKLAAYRYQCELEDAQNDRLVSFVKSMPCSTQKGYISPFKEMVVTQWNKTYKERHAVTGDDYDIYQFFNEGIADQFILANMQHESDERGKDLARLYNDAQCRMYLHQQNPSYDAYSGIGAIPKGWKINANDIEVELPPELKQSEYVKRRDKFFNAIFANNKLNLQTKY
jgi:hypothetical protein